jgi:hypothetical protein
MVMHLTGHLLVVFMVVPRIQTSIVGVMQAM